MYRVRSKGGLLRLYVANIAVNLRSCDLLQQWKTQMNNLAVSEIDHRTTHVSGKDIVRYYKKHTLTIQVVKT